MPDHIDVPVLRIELNHIKQAMLHALEVRHGELANAIDEGITLAYETIPLLVAERVRSGLLIAAKEATEAALKEYYSPGGAGYEKIMEQVIESVKMSSTGSGGSGK